MAEDEKQEIAHFGGQIAKVQTDVSGGFRIWIDGGLKDITQAAFLMPFAVMPGVSVEVVIYRKENEFESGVEKSHATNRRKTKRRDA